MAFKFENLRVWQIALELATDVTVVLKSFPKSENYGLASQFQCAIDSVCLNIAEGSTGQSDKEFSKFLGYSNRSLIECVTRIHLAKKRGYLTDDQCHKFYTEFESLIRQPQSLRNSSNK